MTISTNDMHKISKFNVDEIKNLIDSFNIKDEKFINNTYNATFEINFNKQNTFYLLKKKYISILPNKKNNFITNFSRSSLSKC